MIVSESKTIHSICPICDQRKRFEFHENNWRCRDSTSMECPFSQCVTRERAVAKVIKSLWKVDDLVLMSIHESAPANRGLSKWLLSVCPGYIRTGYFPDRNFGSIIDEVRNEDLECQTFENDIFDLVIHLDVMEHLFNPFLALQEIWRTLRSPGYCIFTVPVEFAREKSEQVAFVENGNVVVKGDPEYHGNPQCPEQNALVTWRYGYDLPFLISERTAFEVEVRRYQSKRSAIIGHMTETFILEKH